MNTNDRTLLLGIIILVSIYEYFIKPNICQKKLREYAKSNNGRLTKMTWL